MRALADLDDARASGVRAVLTDIDDTLTTDGRLAAAAYGALEELQEAGLLVVPITGRPAGWCDMIARFWPVDGVVGENGAFYFRYDRPTRRMRRRYWAAPEERSANRLRLDALGREIVAAVPGAALAADQAYRVADLAIDFCEDVPALPADRIDCIIAMFEEAGATAKASSIHVNGWFGTYDKLSMSRRMLQGEFGLGAEAQAATVLFIGDSPNDEPMFEAFPLSVGVANVLDAASRIRHLPRYVAGERAGRGFVELARRLLDARGAPRERRVA
jgi:HAD superfamily hydrolase (TIGR01484 family)